MVNIDNYSSFLAQNNNFKYFVVTEKQLGVYSLEDIADSYFEQLNVGRKGILILYVNLLLIIFYARLLT